MARIRRSTHRRRRGLAAAIGLALTLGAAACVPGAPTSPNPIGNQLSTRTVDVAVTGSVNYTADDASAVAPGTPGGIVLGYNGSSEVMSVTGTLGFDAGDGPGPSLTLDLAATLFGMSGTARVADPTASVDVTVTGAVAGFSADDRGNVAGTISSAGSTVTFSTTSIALAPGTDPALESLLAAEDDFCADAQQRLAGLDPAEVPLGSITNTREANRDDFTVSKTLLDPLTTRTWTDAVDVATADGGHATVSQRISCKTRAADHVATTGVSTTAVDGECSVLNQRSIDLALAQMTPSQAAAVTVPILGADVVRQTGAEWNTPLAASIEFSGTTLRAHALLTRWTDPAFAIFPDTIRGVHYCTVWSPAFAYAHLLDTLPA